MDKGDDSPQPAIGYVEKLPGRIGPPQKEERGLLREGDDSPQPAIGYVEKLPGRIGPPQKEDGIFDSFIQGVL